MKKAKQTFEKMTKYSIRKLSVGVGPVAIGAFLLGGSLLGARPVTSRSGDPTCSCALRICDRRRADC